MFQFFLVGFNLSTRNTSIFVKKGGGASDFVKKISINACFSASVESIFSIIGHIFSVKRRRLHHKYFSELVFLKLNELFM
jgi:hypothetical protein